MKIEDGYMLREIAGNYVVIPVGQNIVDYKSMLHLNESGAFLWGLMKEEISYEELIEKMAVEYEADEDERDILKRDLDDFIKMVREVGAMA